MPIADMRLVAVPTSPWMPSTRRSILIVEAPQRRRIPLRHLHRSHCVQASRRDNSCVYSVQFPGAVAGTGRAGIPDL
jgi:hypothetical protein